MGEYESLKLWAPVISAIQAGDFKTASEAKTKIEEAQRAIRKQRLETGEVWTPKFFDFVIPSESDANGATARDPQHVGTEEDKDVLGHWSYRDI